MRRFLVCCILLLTLSLVPTACVPTTAPSAEGPTTWLDKPLDGAKLPLGPAEIMAHASDSDGVTSFDFFVDNTLLARVRAEASAPVRVYSTGYSGAPGTGGYLASATVGWNPTTPGVYTVLAVATDTKGNVGSDATSVVMVGEVRTPSASPSAPPEAAPSEPSGEVQIEFTADRTTLMAGECAFLLWTVHGGEAVFLQGEPVELSGEREVCPDQTTTYTLAVYVGLGPPSPPVAEQELVIVVGEPQATTPPPTHAAPTATAVPPTSTSAPPQPTTSPPTPTSPPGCPGSPVISSFTANPSTITAGQSTTLSWGAVTNGNTSQLVGSVVINPGLGEVGSPGSRAVSPQTTTTYTLVATGCGGTAQQQVTVTVNPAVFSADLAITDLYPETLYGPIWVRITNRGGPGTVYDTVQLSCQWNEKDAIEGTSTPGQMGPMPIPISNLGPNQTQAFNTDISINLHSYTYDMTCSMQVPFNDPNTGNNSYSESFP
jgi:hypothetical protein